MKRLLVALCVAGALGACGKKAEEAPPAAPTPAAAPESTPASAPTGTFSAIEAEILVPRCASQPACHQGSAPAGTLDLEAGRAWGTLVGVKAARRPERLRVAPGDPVGSYLVQRLEAGNDTPQMPLGAEPLSASELERIKAWVKEGAKP